MQFFKFAVVLGVAAAVAVPATAPAQVKGSGKASVTIVKMPAPAPATPTPKTAGSVSSKPSATVAGKPPTGGGSFAAKLAKEVGDPAKPGFADGEYVLEIESAGGPGADLINAPAAASFFITLTILGGKCTIHNNPTVTIPAPAPEAVGKCSANIYQVAGTALITAGLVANQPFDGRFRIRNNIDTVNCVTGHLLLDGSGTPILSPPTSTCRMGAVVGAGGVALAAQ